METFPSLSVGPAYPLVETREDAVIRSSSEAGYKMTRPRFTRTIRKIEYKYENATETDKSTVDTFYSVNINNGSSIFIWVHPQTSVSINMRMAKPPKFSLDFNDHYTIEVSLEEA